MKHHHHHCCCCLRVSHQRAHQLTSKDISFCKKGATQEHINVRLETAGMCARSTISARCLQYNVKLGDLKDPPPRGLSRSISRIGSSLSSGFPDNSPRRQQRFSYDEIQLAPKAAVPLHRELKPKQRKSVIRHARSLQVRRDINAVKDLPAWG